MKVELISCTPNAEQILVFTKNTRLDMNASAFEDVKNWTKEAIGMELDYMANTIPSSWEFIDYIFTVEGVSRAYTHQQVRTRAGSYAQQTMRITNMKGFKYVFTKNNLNSAKAMELLQKCIDYINFTYGELIESGQLAEDARGILPTNIATNIVCKFNLRTLSELAKSRTGGRTQDEYRCVVNAMIDEVLKVHPWAEKFLFNNGRDYFNDIEEFAENKLSNAGDRIDLLKMVDKLRKQL